MKIREIMSPPLAWADCYESIEDVRERLIATQRAWVPVRNGGSGEVLGIVSVSEIANSAGPDDDPEITPIGRIVAGPPTCCFEDEDVPVAADLIQARRLRWLLVLNRNREVVGLLSPCEVAAAQPLPASDTRM